MSSSTDCYLCGASNEWDAEFCIRCSGQLLRLPGDGPSADIPEEEATTEVEAPEVEAEGEDSGRRRVGFRRKGSVQDERLSDALGLSDNSDVTDPDFFEAVVTEIPRATPSADIPLIGTRPSAITHSSAAGSPSRRVYVLLGLLLLSTVWLGWTTLSGSGSAPDNLAFEIPATTTTTTTNTEAPRREWTESEIAGRFSDVFVRAELFECGAIDLEARVPTSEVLNDALGSGIAIDGFNSLIDTTALPNANAALLVSRSGSTRIALLQPSDYGTLATSPAPARRDLELDESVEGEARFTVGYSPDTNEVETIESASASSAAAHSVAVNAFGEATAIQITGPEIPVADLTELGDSIEVLAPFEPNQNTCTRAALALELTSTAEAREQAAALDPQEPSAGEENEQDDQSTANDEETDE